VPPRPAPRCGRGQPAGEGERRGGEGRGGGLLAHAPQPAGVLSSEACENQRQDVVGQAVAVALPAPRHPAGGGVEGALGHAQRVRQRGARVRWRAWGSEWFDGLCLHAIPLPARRRDARNAVRGLACTRRERAAGIELHWGAAPTNVEYPDRLLWRRTLASPCSSACRSVRVRLAVSESESEFCASAERAGCCRCIYPRVMGCATPAVLPCQNTCCCSGGGGGGRCWPPAAELATAAPLAPAAAQVHGPATSQLAAKAWILSAAACSRTVTAASSSHRAWCKACAAAYPLTIAARLARRLCCHAPPGAAAGT
jgi:hypothetical protein